MSSLGRPPSAPIARPTPTVGRRPPTYRFASAPVTRCSKNCSSTTCRCVAIWRRARHLERDCGSAVLADLLHGQRIKIFLARAADFGSEFGSARCRQAAEQDAQHAFAFSLLLVGLRTRTADDQHELAAPTIVEIGRAHV